MFWYIWVLYVSLILPGTGGYILVHTAIFWYRLALSGTEKLAAGAPSVELRLLAASRPPSEPEPGGWYRGRKSRRRLVLVSSS